MKNLISFPGNQESESSGISLRDYFAAMAMQVFVSNTETDWEDDARDAYAVADKMLKVRKE